MEFICSYPSLPTGWCQKLMMIIMMMMRMTRTTTRFSYNILLLIIWKSTLRYSCCFVTIRLLKDAADSVQYKKRYQLMFGALLSVAGGGMREEFQKQEDLVKMLAAIADKVKASKDKEVENSQKLISAGGRDLKDASASRAFL